MRANEIRRVVVDENDRVVGILTTDDPGYNLERMSEELAIKYITMIKDLNKVKNEFKTVEKN